LIILDLALVIGPTGTCNGSVNDACWFPSTLDHDRVARQPAEGTGCSLKDFCSHHSKSFDGGGDHICVENWLNDVEGLLATLGCTNEQKVAYTASKLTREAKRWWQDKKVVLVADLGSETAISWEVFKHEFNRHFFPRAMQEAKARVFGFGPRRDVGD
jgi:hypothetical protein